MRKQALQHVDTNPPAAGAVSFGPYLLHAGIRRLERDRTTVQLGDRAFDILCALTERAGEIMTHRELMVRVWGKVVVGAGSLRFHINALRKVLAQDGTQIQYIKNVTRRGYTFIAPVREVTPDSPTVVVTQRSELGRIPRRPPNIIGRAAEIKEIAELLSQSRFVTLVGSGGVGKTTVALELAHSLREQFGLICFVDLDSIKEPSWVTKAVAAAAGLVVSSASPVSSLIACFRERRMLLILDSCERVLEAAAMLSEQLLDGCAKVAILATSQEALRADGERTFLLGPLRTPLEVTQLTSETAPNYPAIGLFVARARAVLPGFQLTPENGADIAAICRSVDGIPLAIELAAGRVGTLALPTIAQLLNTQYALSWPGRRTATERHKTLGGAIAWAIDLLKDDERAVLRRLAVFSAPFTLEAAQCVANGDAIPSAYVATALWNLVARSLISSSCIDGSTHFRLLGVTRAFASRMLEESEEATTVAARHATFFCELLERAYAGPTEVIPATVRYSHAACLGNVRAALAWTQRQKGRTALVARLAAAVGPYFLDLSLLGDCAYWAQIGMNALDAHQRGSSQELELQTSLGLSLFYGRGGIEQVRTCLNRALQLADEHGDPHNQMRLLGALNLFHERSGDLQEALYLVQRAQSVAVSLDDPACLAMANWLFGTAAHLKGDHVTARRVCEQSWGRPPRFSLVRRAGFELDDHRVRSLCALVRSLWLLGKAEEAQRTAVRVLQEAERIGHPIPLANALAGIAPLWIWVGELEVAQAYVSRLSEHAAQHSMAIHTAVARGLQGHLAVERGDAAAGLEALREGSHVLRASRFEMFRSYFAEPAARALAALGRMDEATVAIDEALKLHDASRTSFMLPELLRAKADLLAAHFPDHSVDAEALLRLSYELARRQGALAWQLRASMSLARLHSPQEPTHDRYLLLWDTYSQFTEGFNTPDLVLARRALAAATAHEPPSQRRRIPAEPPFRGTVKRTQMR
jgi:predicted ATPase/DNA-binding winged helix-turn-helix (wHTH) protein